MPNIPVPLPDMNTTEEKFFSRRNIIALLTVGIMFLIIPVGVKLSQETQIFKSRAAAAPVKFVPNAYTQCDVQEENCTTSLNIVQVNLRSPMGPPAVPTAPPPTPTWNPLTPTPTLRPGVTPTPLPPMFCYSQCAPSEKDKRTSNGLICGNEWCSSSKTCPAAPGDLKWYDINCPTYTDCKCPSGD